MLQFSMPWPSSFQFYKGYSSTISILARTAWMLISSLPWPSSFQFYTGRSSIISILARTAWMLQSSMPWPSSFQVYRGRSWSLVRSWHPGQNILDAAILPVLALKLAIL